MSSPSMLTYLANEAAVGEEPQSEHVFAAPLETPPRRASSVSPKKRKPGDFDAHVSTPGSPPPSQMSSQTRLARSQIRRSDPWPLGRLLSEKNSVLRVGDVLW